MSRPPFRRLRLTRLDDRTAPAALTAGNLLQAYTDTDLTTQTDNIGGAEVAVPGGADVQNRTFQFPLASLDKINGGVAIANGIVYFAAYTPNGPFGDDLTALFRYTPAADKLELVNTYNRESGGLAFLPDGSLVNAWFDGVYGGQNPVGPDSGTVGLSKIDPATGAETVLFTEAVTIGSNQAYATIPRPTAVAAVGGKYFFTTSVAGQVPFSVFPPVDDSSTLRRFDPAAPGTAPVIAQANREAYALAATADGKLVEQWYDGVYDKTSQFSAASATIGVSRIDPATGAESVLATEAVPNLPQQLDVPTTPPPTRPGGLAVLADGRVAFAVTQPSITFFDPFGTPQNFRNRTTIRIVDPAVPGTVVNLASSARFTTGLAPVPAPPATGADAFTTPVNKSLTVAAPGVLANDSSPNTSNPLKAAVVTPPPVGQGTVALNADGSFKFTPAAGFVGSATFTYTASDGFAVSAPTTVTITVTNQAPVAAPDSYSTPVGQALTVAAPGILGNDTDADGPNPLTTSLVSPPAAGQGALTLSANGSFTFTPAAGFVGKATFTYAATDGKAASAPATVTITVTNQTPAAAPDSYSTPAGKALTIAAAGVLGNDTDPDGPNPLTAVLVAAPPAAEGALTLNANGSFTFTPATGFAGTTSFSYKASDGVASSAPATVTIAVTNQTPVAAPDNYSTPAGKALTIAAPGLLANDSDPDNTGPLAAVLVAAPPAAEGALTLNANGSFTFTPATGFAGVTSFTYAASDGVAAGTPATVTITVTNDAPVAAADAFTTPAGQPLNVAAPGLLANDSDPDNTGPLAATLVSGLPAGQGSVAVGPDGAFTFIPAAGFSGTATFTYAVSDGIATSAPATVTITVTPPANQPPVSQPDAYAAAAGQTLTVPAATGVLANDADPDDTGPLTAVLVSPPPASEGAVALNADGSFTFTPAAGFVGTTSFTYAASDGQAQGAPAAVTINVGNQPPVGLADEYTVFAGRPLNVAAPGLLANDTDPDDTGPLTASLAAAPGGTGTVVVNPDGSFTLTPTPGFTGVLTFSYRVSDGFGESQPVTVTVTVLPEDARVRLLAVGAGAGGGPRVRVFDAAGSPLLDFFAYEESFTGGVRVAVGDVTGDGTDDVIVGAGTGGGPRVRVFDGVTGAVVADFFAYEDSFRGGVHVAAADLNGDGVAEIVTGAGSTGGPRVRVLDGRTLAPLQDFYAFSAEHLGGVRVAAGDLTGDGFADVAAAEGPSGDGEVRVFDGRTAALASSARPFGDYRGGLFVAAAPGGGLFASKDSVPDYDGSLFAAVAPGLPSSQVTSPPAAVQVRPTPGAVVVPYPEDFLGGVRVGGGPGADGEFDFVTAPGPDGGSLVRFYKSRADGGADLVREFAAFEDAFRGGVFVAASV